MDELETRIEALERAVTEGDHDLSELAAEGETRDRLAAAEADLGDLADRVAELEAATQALRGYVGNVRAVNRDVEKRADAALAKAESLESAVVDGDEPPDNGGQAGPPGTATGSDPPVTADPTRSSETDSRTNTGGQRAEPGDGHRERCQACGRPTGAGGHGHRAGPITDTDRLDAVFERGGSPENGDDGTFDRIRRML